MPFQSTKDVVIRFTGQDLLGPSIRSAEQKLVSFRDRIGKSGAGFLQAAGQGVGGRFGAGVGSLLAGGAGGLAAFAASDLVSRAIGPVMRSATENIAQSFGIVTERAREAATAMSDLSRTVRQQTAKITQGALAPSAAAQQSLFGGLMPEGGLAGMFFGQRQGRFASALSGIGDQRQELLRQQRAGLPASFRQKAMQQELKNLDDTRGLWDSFLMSLPGGGEARANADITMARANVNRRATMELGNRNRRFRSTFDELSKREQQLGAIAGLERGFAGFGAGAMSAGQGTLGFLGRFGGILGGAFGSTFGDAAQRFQMNRDARLATESPAERLRRELGNLEAERGRGLSPEMYGRRRRQLLRGAMAGLSDSPHNDLQATESRFLTRGRDQRPEDDLKRTLHEDNQRQESALRELIELERNKKSLEVVER